MVGGEMSIPRIQGMREELIRDEMNYAKSLPTHRDLLEFVESLLREKYESLPERHIIEDYESMK
jgi:hypothetical protein